MINREIDRTLPAPNPISDAVAVAILAALELVAIWCVIRIWREPARSVPVRVLWTAVTLVPVLGLIAFAVWREPPPPPRDPTDRRREAERSEYVD